LTHWYYVVGRSANCVPRLTFSGRGSGKPRGMALHYDFSDRVALVTGGSQGIGAGIAAAFTQAGAAVVITARSNERLQKTAAELRNDGGRVLAVPADVTDEDAVRALVDKCVQEFGRLDFAVNNATDGPMPAPLAEIPSDGFSLGIRTNINGTFYGMKHQIPAMLASGGGVIINMASVAGLGATSNLSAYVSGKAGIIGLSRSAALDYADQGVRINVIAPGPILTDHLRAAGETAQQMAAQSVPLGRIGTTDDVAACVLWLCSDDASFITGVTLPVDGGQSAGTKLRQTYRPGQSMDEPADEPPVRHQAQAASAR
jgi:NAD(P)-dependent dehydrogenase (short-subunit alcohol dehydrogenase family)